MLNIESRERREHGISLWRFKKTTIWLWYLVYSGANLLVSGSSRMILPSCVPCPDYKMCSGKGQDLFCLPFYPQTLEQSRCSIIWRFLFPWVKHRRSCSLTDCPSLSISLVRKGDTESPGIGHMFNLPENPGNERTLNTYPAINKITLGFSFVYGEHPSSNTHQRGQARSWSQKVILKA